MLNDNELIKLIEQGQSYRNPTIVEVIKNMGFMQKFGRGLVTVREELKSNGNPPADFDISENFVSVTIKKRK